MFKQLNVEANNNLDEPITVYIDATVIAFSNIDAMENVGESVNSFLRKSRYLKDKWEKHNLLIFIA